MKSLKLKIFSLNLLFSTCLIILFLLIKEQIINYIKFLKESAPKLIELQTALAQNITSNIVDLQNSINDITKNVTNFMLFQYLLMPLILFILWVLFQGIIFYLLTNSKNIKKYFLKFSLITLIFFVITILLIKFILLSIPILFFIIFFVLFYYLLLLYLNLNKPLKVALKTSLKFNLKLFLIYLLLILLISLCLLLEFILILSILGGNYFSLVILLPTFLILLLLLTLVEIYFSKNI